MISNTYVINIYNNIWSIQLLHYVQMYTYLQIKYCLYD
jgi:hypothetical protein